MKATIKSVILNRDREITNQETGEKTTIKDNRLVYRITEATPEELEQFKAWRGEKYEECEKTKQPIYFDWGVSEPTVEVVLAKDKKDGSTYAFTRKSPKLMLAEQDYAKAKAEDDRDEMRFLKSEIRDIKAEMISKLQKFISRNEVAVKDEVPGQDL